MQKLRNDRRLQRFLLCNLRFAGRPPRATRKAEQSRKAGDRTGPPLMDLLSPEKPAPTRRGLFSVALDAHPCFTHQEIQQTVLFGTKTAQRRLRVRHVLRNIAVAVGQSDDARMDIA